ncbi:MAG: hypothetical protein M1825_003109 [Sarcosagium campestre]|nr:MAG: hypothetical protein M1825_003109 [Sarcosagium campestre]
MAPSATSPVTTQELTDAAISNSIAQSARSLLSDPASQPVKGLAELDASRLKITHTTAPRPVPAPNSPEILSQSVCTDHMVTAKWTSHGGWEAPEIKPYGAFSLMPTASVFHYATECFEGMKVYRGYDGKLRLFRPDRNAERMLISSARGALPPFAPSELEKLIARFVAYDCPKWLPKSRPGAFLYLRPTMIGTVAALGVQKPSEAMLFVIACVFPSYDNPQSIIGANPHPTDAEKKQRPGLKLLGSKEDMVRAWPGGFGYAKLGANYCGTLMAQSEARDQGYDQILWLFGSECFVTEAGAANFFVVWRTKEGALQLVTAPLDDKIILDGVTRRSVLELARNRLARTWDSGDGAHIEALEVVERKYTMHEVEEAVLEGRLVEAFSSGTAFFISPVSEIHFRGKDLHVPLDQGTTGRYASLMKTWLSNIMFGKETHAWGSVVEEET